MTQRYAEPTGPVEQISLSSAPSFGRSALPAGPSEEEQAELLDYTPVPPRNTQMLVARFRPGARLRPLPYLLDEEDS